MSRRIQCAILALAVSLIPLATACAGQRQDQSGPSAAQPVPGESHGTRSDAARSVPPAGRSYYANTAHGFRITHPERFVVRPQDVSGLAQFQPAPVASIFFMNPTMAAGALAGMEPPDLEVRVYRAGSADSLKNWLVSAGFASPDGGADVQPYRVAGVNGLKVCQSTLISPGCSVYVLHAGRVYQLTAASTEGEAMLRTFTLLP